MSYHSLLYMLYSYMLGEGGEGGKIGPQTRESIEWS
jgi:hypothetical protein